MSPFPVVVGRMEDKNLQKTILAKTCKPNGTATRTSPSRMLLGSANVQKLQEKCERQPTDSQAPKLSILMAMGPEPADVPDGHHLPLVKQLLAAKNKDVTYPYSNFLEFKIRTS